MLRNILDYKKIGKNMDSTQAYAEVQMSGLSENELETRALIHTASALNAIKENWEEKKSELPQALEKNRRLWTILATAMGEPDCPQDKSVKINIINLSIFIFKRTNMLLAATDPKPEQLNILIDINMNIARGLAENINAAEQAPNHPASTQEVL